MMTLCNVLARAILAEVSMAKESQRRRANWGDTRWPHVS